MTMKRKQKLRLNCKITSAERQPKVEPVLLYFSLCAADELLLFHSASGEISVNKEVLNHFLGQSKQSESKPALELSSLLRLLLV